MSAKQKPLLLSKTNAVMRLSGFRLLKTAGSGPA
jgi:hypothetical protein